MNGSTWPRVRLKDLGTWFGGGTPSKSNRAFWIDGTVPWLSPKDMGPEVLAGTQDHITQDAVESSSVKRVPAGSVALVVRSGILERTLPVALVPFDTTLNQDMKAVAARPDIDARWIAWGLRAYEQEILDTCRKAGTTVASMEMPRLYEHTIPVPPLDKQRRIVDILEDHLSRLDAAASSVEAAERRLIALRRSTLNTLFSGSDYPRVPLRELVVGIEAGRSFGGSSHPASDDEWGIIKVSAMTWGTFRANENKAIASDRADARYEINKGDLLISRANTTAYVGASVLVGEVRPRLLLSDKSLRILAAPGVEREWLWRALSAPDARSQMSAAATGTKDSMRNISQPALLNIELSAVPVADQKAAVAISLEVETGIQRLTVDLEAAAVRGERLRQALLGAAFSGRLTGRATDMEMVEEMASV
jgi:type I restriction enzyme S subunit